MSVFTEAFNYAKEHPNQLMNALEQHLLLVGVPLVIGIAISLPLGFISSRYRLASNVLTNGFNSLRVIPSLAILFVAIPAFGLTFQSAAIALTLLVIPPILLNTDVAFRTINPDILEAATGMGMSSRQRLLQIELPLVLPVILAGIKTATIEAISSATLAAFIGAGGLGDFIILGFSLYDNGILLVGAVPVAILAIIAEICLGLLENFFKQYSHR